MTAPLWRDNHRGCGDEALYVRLSLLARAIADAHAPVERLPMLADLLWDALSARGLSWVGFYVIDEQFPIDRASATGQLLLAARRDTPACSPIGLHGVCGQGFLEEQARLVEDVGLLGAGYIACDPRDRSEVVLPIYRNGQCWGVLDADSHQVRCFGDIDVWGLSQFLQSGGLLAKPLSLRADRLQEPAGLL